MKLNQLSAVTFIFISNIGHSHREEYVQDDSGLMYRGVYNVTKPVPWFYGQYEKDILECALYLVRELGKVRIWVHLVSVDINLPFSYL